MEQSAASIRSSRGVLFVTCSVVESQPGRPAPELRRTRVQGKSPLRGAFWLGAGHPVTTALSGHEEAAGELRGLAGRGRDVGGGPLTHDRNAGGEPTQDRNVGRGSI